MNNELNMPPVEITLDKHPCPADVAASRRMDFVLLLDIFLLGLLFGLGYVAASRRMDFVLILDIFLLGLLFGLGLRGL